MFWKSCWGRKHRNENPYVIQCVLHLGVCARRLRFQLRWRSLSNLLFGVRRAQAEPRLLEFQGSWNFLRHLVSVTECHCLYWSSAGGWRKGWGGLVVFDKWRGPFWFMRLDTVFDNPGLWSYGHLTRDVVGFGGLNSFLSNQNCSSVFYVSYLIFLFFFFRFDAGV